MLTLLAKPFFFLLQVLDDSRNWWKLKNHEGHIGYAPYTILKEYGDMDVDKVDNSVYPSSFLPNKITWLSELMKVGYFHRIYKLLM